MGGGNVLNANRFAPLRPTSLATSCFTLEDSPENDVEDVVELSPLKQLCSTISWNVRRLNLTGQLQYPPTLVTNKKMRDLVCGTYVVFIARCSWCGRRYVLEARLRHHKQECSSSPNTTKFTCKVCSKVFYNHQKYIDHVPIHSFM